MSCHRHQKNKLHFSDFKTYEWKLFCYDYNENMADDTVTFFQPDLPINAFPNIADIRRLGQLCDVTLKVRGGMVYPNKS